VHSYLCVFVISFYFLVVRYSFHCYTDPDVPFVPSPVPYSNHVLTNNEMEIQCLVSDPTANVTLVNVDTQQPVPCVYDSKRGALGVFPAGTYVCKALINGEVHESWEYIVHGWTGVFSSVCQCVKLVKHLLKKIHNVFCWIC